MGHIVKLNNGAEMEIIDHIEPIIVTRTHWTDPEHGFILEARSKIKDTEQFFFLQENKDNFAFRVCKHSYFDYYANGNELPEFRDSVEIIEEFLNEKEIKDEYRILYNVLHALGSVVAHGISVPVL